MVQFLKFVAKRTYKNPPPTVCYEEIEWRYRHGSNDIVMRNFNLMIKKLIIFPLAVKNFYLNFGMVICWIFSILEDIILKFWGNTLFGIICRWQLKFYPGGTLGGNFAFLGEIVVFRGLKSIKLQGDVSLRIWEIIRREKREKGFCELLQRLQKSFFPGGPNLVSTVDSGLKCAHFWRKYPIWTARGKTILKSLE